MSIASEDLNNFIAILKDAISQALGRCYRDLSKKLPNGTDYYYCAGQASILTELRDDLRDFEKKALLMSYGEPKDED